MKTYVLMLAKQYPKDHFLQDVETNFPDKIRTGWKIHTIRQNYPLWEKRFDKINKGEAQISVRYWTGKPYRSKQVELFLFKKEDGIGLQELYLKALGGKEQIETLAYNDGLGYKEFLDWFRNVDAFKPLALIHFTKFRYNG